MSDSYPIIDVADWPAAGAEAMGSKRKVWLRVPESTGRRRGERWLFKQPGRSASGDTWAEKVAAELAAALGLPHAKVELSNRGGVTGVIVRDILRGEAGAELVHGNSLLFQADDTYPMANRKRVEKTQHTWDRIAAVLDSPSIGLPIGTPSTPAVRSATDLFTGYLMFDALIGNTDRHHENWAVVRLVSPPDASVLSPTYDHAACLGHNLKDDERLARLTTADRGYSVAAFVRKARSEIYPAPGNTPALRPLEVFRLAAESHPEAARYWLDRLRCLEENVVSDIVSRVPDAIMTGVARRFARAVLAANTTNLSVDPPS